MRIHGVCACFDFRLLLIILGACSGATLFIIFSDMNKILIIATLLIMTSCTMPWNKDHYEHPNLSGEVPKEAKTVEGYTYPAVPLDQFNASNTGSARQQ